MRVFTRQWETFASAAARLFAVFLCVVTASFLCACSVPLSETAQGKKILDSFTQTYQADISLDLGALTLCARLSANPGNFRVTLSQPQSLAGYSYIFRDGVFDMSYKNLTFRLNGVSKADPGGTPPLAKAVFALQALLSPQPGVLPKRQDGGWELTGEVDGITCALWIDDSGGVPAKLLLHDGEIEISLENFSFSD